MVQGILGVQGIPGLNQSLSCATVISTKFSELLSLKGIYVKYKNAYFVTFRLLFSHMKRSDTCMGVYFHRNFITTVKHIVIVNAIKYLGKYMTICLILACEKEAIYM